MDGRAFLAPARELAAGKTEAHWRSAAVNAYYALFLECRDALTRWGVPIPPKQSVHSSVRLKLSFAADGDLKAMGIALEELGKLRNRASYQLDPVAEFATPADALAAIKDAENTLAVLDAIEADPARRAAAVAALPP